MCLIKVFNFGVHFGLLTMVHGKEHMVYSGWTTPCGRPISSSSSPIWNCWKFNVLLGHMLFMIEIELLGEAKLRSHFSFFWVWKHKDITGIS